MQLLCARVVYHWEKLRAEAMVSKLRAQRAFTLVTRQEETDETKEEESSVMKRKKGGTRVDVPDFKGATARVVDVQDARFVCAHPRFESIRVHSILLR